MHINLAKLLFVGAVSFFAASGSVVAQPGPSVNIKAVIEEVQRTVKAEKDTLSEEALDAKLKKLIEPMFDFKEMAQRSVGAYWSKGSAEQQQQFIELFSDLLGRTYLKRIKRNAESSKIQEISEQIDGAKAMVHSTVFAEGENVQIDYRLLLENGQWKIYDVIIENVGLVSNYRNEFPEIIRKEGFEGLITRLKNKQAGNNAPVPK